MDKALKYTLMGAGVQLTAKTASSLGYYYLKSQGWTDAQINATGWYNSIPGVGAMAPSVDDWVLDLGLPAGLYLGGKLLEKRSSAKANMLKDMALGAGLTGIATFMHDLINRVGPTAFAPAVSYAQRPANMASPQRYSIAPAVKGAYR